MQPNAQDHLSKRLDHVSKDGRGDVRRHARQSVQQLRQRLHVFQPVASLDGSRKEGVINFRLQNEVKDTLDVALRSVRRQAFVQDGARHGVHGDVWGHAPSLSCAKTRACRSLLNDTLLARTPLEDISTVDFGAASRRPTLRCALSRVL